MGRAAKFAILSRSERRLVIDAACAVALARLGLWTLPLATVRRIAAGRGRPRASLSPRPDEERISWAVTTAGRVIPGGTNCLVKALAAQAMLARFGYRTQLRFGAGKTRCGEFEAHAWLESEGRIVIGQFDLGRYAAMSGRGASR